MTQGYVEFERCKQVVRLPLSHWTRQSKEYEFWQAWHNGLITIWDIAHKQGWNASHIHYCEYTGLTQGV